MRAVIVIVSTFFASCTTAFSTATASMPASQRLAARRAAPVECVASVFIDGEAGTTGLQVRERLAKRSDIELITLPEDKRKDATARAEAINAADAVILCLPDAAAIEAVALVAPDNDRTVFIDASTAHRIDPAWDYGFPELCGTQRASLAASKRIANPGCYATGFIALMRPLVDAGLLRRSAKLVRANARANARGTARGHPRPPRKNGTWRRAGWRVCVHARRSA